MVWSLQGFFPFVIEFASAFYFAICIILLFLNVPKTDAYLPYRKAKWCMAASFFVMGCNLIAWLFLTNSGLDSWVELSPFVMLTDFLFFYVGTLFFACAFSYLVEPRYFTPKRKLFDGIIFSCSCLLIVLSVIFNRNEKSVWLAVAAFSLFVIHVMLFLYRFYSSTRSVRRCWRITLLRICSISCSGSRRVSYSWSACFSWPA